MFREVQKKLTCVALDFKFFCLDKTKWIFQILSTSLKFGSDLQLLSLLSTVIQFIQNQLTNLLWISIDKISKMNIGWDVKLRIFWVLKMLLLLSYEHWVFCSFRIYARRWKESVMAQSAKGACVCIQFHLKWFLVILVAFLKWELNFIHGNEVLGFIYRARRAFTLVVEPGKSFETRL